MDIIHQVVISETPNFSSNTMFMDILKPKDAKRCFMCVDKFNASYPINAIAVFNVFPPTEEFEVRCNAIQNSYRYDSVSKMVLRSDLLDSFVTRDILSLTLGGQTQNVAVFQVINSMNNWQEIDMNRLPQIKFTFVNNYNSAAGMFTFNLHLKFKFTE